MLKEIYCCDFCGGNVPKSVEPNQWPKAIPIRWKAMSLERSPDWVNCPKHLCVNCLNAIADLRDDLRRLRLIDG